MVRQGPQTHPWSCDGPDTTSLCRHQALMWQEAGDAPKLQQWLRFRIFQVLLIASIIALNKFWPLLSLILVGPYMLVKSEVLHLQLISFVMGAQDLSLHDLMSIWFRTEGDSGQRTEVWRFAFFICHRNQWRWKSHFIFYTMLTNCPFVLSLLYFYWTCRQTSPLAGGKNKLPATHTDEMPFSSGAPQIIDFSFQCLNGKTGNTFWFGSLPKGVCFFSSLISFHKHCMRHSGLRLFSAFHYWEKEEK